MNRYLLQGLLEDIRRGKRVGVLTPYRTEAREIFTSVMRELDEREVDKVYHTNGAEAVIHVNAPGALNLLHADAGHSFRAAGLDVLVVIDWNVLTGAMQTGLLYATRDKTELVRF